MRSGQRRVALHVGLLALNVVGIILLLGWREIVTAYHGLRLRSDPAAFDELLGAEDGSPGWEALESYAREPEGRERLLSAYLAASIGIDSNVRDWLERLGPRHADDEWVLLWYYNGQRGLEHWCDMPNWSFRGGGGTRKVESAPEGRKLESLQRLMGSSPFERVPHPDWPGLEFTVFPRASDPVRTEYWFTQHSDWPGCRMLVVTREGTPFPRLIQESGKSEFLAR